MMMKMLITGDSPASRAGASRCAPSFDPEHIRSVVTTLQSLRINACDEIQGYFFSRRLGGPAVTAFLRERQRAIPS